MTCNVVCQELKLKLNGQQRILLANLCLVEQNPGLDRLIDSSCKSLTTIAKRQLSHPSITQSL